MKKSILKKAMSEGDIPENDDLIDFSKFTDLPEHEFASQINKVYRKINEIERKLDIVKKDQIQSIYKKIDNIQSIIDRSKKPSAKR